MSFPFQEKKLHFCRKILANKTLHFPTIESTNRWLLEEINHCGTIISSDFQKEGKGRLGRSWEGKPKQSLMFSVLYRFKPEFFSVLSLVAGCALCSALRKIVLQPIYLKWPNDLLVGNKKIGGILCEAQPQKKIIVIGAGINVLQKNADFSPQIYKKASSLKIETGKNFNIFSLLEKCTLALDKILIRLERGEKKQILQEWEKMASPARNIVYQKTIFQPNKSQTQNITAKIEGIDYNNGSLLVRTKDGKKVSLFSGEITIKDFV